ncbi:hypothetical protein [Anabaena sp. CCY 9402-a]|uniref:hypothetical protein n=1 Tax=Anabaena sp. CCY 9402-a TaxID=3103867 RepID=UPI0039C5B9F4
MVAHKSPNFKIIKRWLFSSEIDTVLSKHLAVESGSLNPITGTFKPGKASDYQKELNALKKSLLDAIQDDSREHYPMVRLGHDLIVGVHIEDWKLFCVIDTSSRGFASARFDPEFEGIEYFDFEFSAFDWAKKYKNRLKFAQL